jgi:hypothetical protein
MFACKIVAPQLSVVQAEGAVQSSEPADAKLDSARATPPSAPKSTNLRGFMPKF